MEKEKYAKVLRLILPPFAVFALTAAFYLVTYVPSVWYADAFTYVTHAVAWHRGDGVYLFPLHNLDYIGWIWLVSLLPATRVATVCNAVSILLGAKLLSIFFTILATVGIYLVAKRLFDSTKSAFIVAALFAANPVIWLEGQGALTDLPAVALMLFSFLFLVRFWQGRKWLDLAVGAFVASLAGVVRAESLLILVIYLVTVIAVTVEGRQTLAVRLKTFLKLGATVGVCSAVLPLLVFGLPWQLQSAVMPLGVPSLKDLLIGWKWYILRDVGWFWCLLAWTGFAIGLYRRQTRALAIGLAAFIVIGSSYFASDNQTGADIPRFLVPTIPFTLLGIGFLWSVGRKQLARAALAILTAVYVVMVFVGLKSPQVPGSKEPSALAKVFALPYYLAANVSGGYASQSPALMYYNAVRTVLPDGVAIILQGDNDLNGAYTVNLGVKPPMRIIKINRDLPVPERFKEIVALPAGKPVYVYPGPDDDAIKTMLISRGFVARDGVCGAELFN